MRKGFPFAGAIDHQIMAMKETGVTRQLIKKYLRPEKRSLESLCGASMDGEGEDGSVLGGTELFFGVVVTGMALAVLFALCEALSVSVGGLRKVG